MRTLVVVTRSESAARQPASMPASRQPRVSRLPLPSWPMTPISVAWPPSAVMLCATLAAPPMRCVSSRNATTGTGASGEMRVTRPTRNVSSIASPMTSTCVLENAETRRDARSGASGNSVIIAARRRKRQRDEHEEQHQKLGVAEVVFEESGGEHRADRRERRCGRNFVALTSKQPELRDDKREDEPQPDGERRQAALRGNLQRHVVEVRIDGIDRVVGAVLRVDARDHIGTDPGERVVVDH